jgi:phage terminase Nu1 subunit (DNA packaging protein)
MELSGLLVTSQEISILFGVSRRTVENWKREGMPHMKRGIPFCEAFKWWRAERFKELGELREARTRREIARARMAELEMQGKEGSLIDRNVPIEWLRGHIFEVKTVLEGIPRRLSGELAPIQNEKEIEFVLRREIRSIENQLSSPLKKGGKYEKKGN